MSLSRKSVAPLLALVPIALIGQVSAAAAASPTNDRVDELRALLSGRSAITSASASTPRRSEAVRTFGDAQQQAREVLLAIPARTPAAPHSYASKPSRIRVRADAQSQAQEVILGRVAAPKAGA